MEFSQCDVGVKRLLSGSHRTRLPEETLAQILPMKHRFAITRVANVTGLDRIGLPVAVAIRPNSRSVAVSQGKGTSLDAAKASAVMEAIELWHAENIVRPLIFAAREDIDRPVIDVSRLPRVAGSRYSDYLRLHWIEGTELLSEETILVPHEMVHADYRLPVHPGHGCFPASSNGLASGNHLIEATCHGICEVIERDALTLWHHLPAQARGATMIDCTTIDSAECRQIIRAIERAGLEVALWDATSDVGIATFHCLLTDHTDSCGHMGLGSGTHPDRTVALTRALTEAVQTRMNYITGSRDDLSFEEFMAEGRAHKAKEARALLRKGRQPPPCRTGGRCYAMPGVICLLR
jgi:YcaO-like protein with predicted kinase domain